MDDSLNIRRISAYMATATSAAILILMSKGIFDRFLLRTSNIVPLFRIQQIHCYSYFPSVYYTNLNIRIVTYLDMYSVTRKNSQSEVQTTPKNFTMFLFLSWLELKVTTKLAKDWTTSKIIIVISWNYGLGSLPDDFDFSTEGTDSVGFHVFELDAFEGHRVSIYGAFVHYSHSPIGNHFDKLHVLDPNLRNLCVG